MPIVGGDLYLPGAGDGQPGVLTLPGSGFAVPAGIEAALEFNGLFLNVRKNIDRYRITTIDGLADADVRDTRDVNTDDDGEEPFNSFYGGRTIVIGGVIDTFSVSKLRDMQKALREAFNDLTTEYPLIFRLGDFTKDHFIKCKKISPISGIEQQSNRRPTRDFQITLRASNPRYLSYYEAFLTATPPVTLGSVELFVATNAGNYWAQPVYRIYGPASTATIINDTLGTSFTVTNIPNDDYFEYSIATKSIKDGLGNNRWNHLDDDSDYVKLKRGPNSIFYSGNSPRIDLAWRHSWM